jgi:hypothetical protein
MDVVVPSVKGLRGIQPTVKGLAARAALSRNASKRDAVRENGEGTSRQPAGSKPYDLSLSPYAIKRAEHLNAFSGASAKDVMDGLKQAVAGIVGHVSLQHAGDEAGASAALKAVQVGLPKFRAAADSLIREIQAERAAIKNARGPNQSVIDKAIQADPVLQRRVVHAADSISNPLVLDSRKIELARQRAAELVGANNPARVMLGLPDDTTEGYVLNSMKK